MDKTDDINVDNEMSHTNDNVNDQQIFTIEGDLTDNIQDYVVDTEETVCPDQAAEQNQEVVIEKIETEQVIESTQSEQGQHKSDHDEVQQQRQDERQTKVEHEAATEPNQQDNQLKTQTQQKEQHELQETQTVEEEIKAISDSKTEPKETVHEQEAKQLTDATINNNNQDTTHEHDNKQTESSQDIKETPPLNSAIGSQITSDSPVHEILDQHGNEKEEPTKQSPSKTDTKSQYVNSPMVAPHEDIQKAYTAMFGEISYQDDLNNPAGRVICDTVPTMNSQSSDLVNDTQTQSHNISSNKDDQIQNAQSNKQTSALYKQTHQPIVAKLAQNPIPQQAAAPKAAVYSHTIQRSLSQQNPQTNKRSENNNNNLHIGSEVISSESGPSLTIFLRRPNSERGWGFTFYGGSEQGCPPFINKVTMNGLGHQHGLEVGDVIISVCNSLTVGKKYEQIKAEMLRAGNELDLILIRRGVDLNQIATIAPHVVLGSSILPSSALRQSTSDVDDSGRRSGTRSLTRGRSFRPVQTRSLRILEQQLNTGEYSADTVKQKTTTPSPRGLSASSLTRSFTTPYGQNPYHSNVVMCDQQQTNTQTVSKVHINTNQMYQAPVNFHNSYDRQNHDVPDRGTNTAYTQWTNQPTPNVRWAQTVPHNQHYQPPLSQQQYPIPNYTQRNVVINPRQIPMQTPNSYGQNPYHQMQ